ncbi:MAG TPA: alpha/beta fold hydrolase [Steroidobacteraceae bacterium]|nr:alpha/beta fold hydrolase [Steroidobacteraceae bacterium]
MANGCRLLALTPLRWSQVLLVALTGVVSAVSGSTEAHLQMLISGHGARTVVLASGLGDTLDIWKTVQPLIADHCARTIAYTRAGYPGSDVADGARDAASNVSELRAELKRRGIQPPYVLVGHSLGGLYMQYFARQYPDEIDGLVLIDSTHWDQHLQLNPQGAGASDRGSFVLLSMPWIMRRELNDSTAAGEQVHASPHAGNVPTIVLSRTRALHGETPAAQALSALMQDDITSDFPAARHLQVFDSGHYIQRDRPEVVVDAARELAGCAPLLAKR